MTLLFHITGEGGQTHCGLFVEDVLSDLSGASSRGKNYIQSTAVRWFPGDAVCVTCASKAAPCQLRACQSIVKGVRVVLCDCGGLRPPGVVCGR